MVEGIDDILKRAIRDTIWPRVRNQQQASQRLPALPALSAPALLRGLQFEIDEMISPALASQSSNVTKVRHDLERISINGQNPGANIGPVRDVIRSELLPKAVEVVGLYRRMSGKCDELRAGQKEFLQDFDRALEVVEKLMI